MFPTLPQPAELRPQSRLGLPFRSHPMRAAAAAAAAATAALLCGCGLAQAAPTTVSATATVSGHGAGGAPTIKLALGKASPAGDAWATYEPTYLTIGWDVIRARAAAGSCIELLPPPRPFSPLVPVSAVACT